jgi:4-hydroxybenzoate polyprenyltransferase
MRDDAKAGVYSAPLLFGSHVKPIVGLFGGVTVICFAISGVENNMGASYFMIGVCGTALHLAKQLHGFDPHSTSSCAKLVRLVYLFLHSLLTVFFLTSFMLIATNLAPSSG